MRFDTVIFLWVDLRHCQSQHQSSEQVNTGLASELRISSVKLTAVTLALSGEEVVEVLDSTTSKRKPDPWKSGTRLHARHYTLNGWLANAMKSMTYSVMAFTHFNGSCPLFNVF